MTGRNQSPIVAGVSDDGELTIPEPLREACDIEAPAEVFVYDAGDRIVVEPIPSADDLHGIHAGENDRGEIAEKVREHRESAGRREG